MTDRLSKHLLDSSSTALFVCDVQEKFRPAILHFETLVSAVTRLMEGAKLLEVPIIVTEQYPKGLGATVKELPAENAVGIFPKTKFTMCVPEVESQLETLCASKPVKSVILCGIEAHVCVLQTAFDLLGRGISVHVIGEAVSSRTQTDRILAIRRLEAAGAVISTVETALFQLLGEKDHPQFKSIQGLIRNSLSETGLASL